MAPVTLTDETEIQAEIVLGLLGQPTTRMMLVHLARSPEGQCLQEELVKASGTHPGNVTKHIQVLLASGLVVRDRQISKGGPFVCRIRREKLAPALAYLQALATLEPALDVAPESPNGSPRP